jgi:micrococcal nuclease
MYSYQATVIRIIDGDTVELSIDLGFSINFKQIVRMYGINAPEKNTEYGKVTLQRITDLIPPGTIVKIETIKDKKEKFGRYLGIIYKNSTNIGLQLILEGLAIQYYP